MLSSMIEHGCGLGRGYLVVAVVFSSCRLYRSCSPRCSRSRGRSGRCCRLSPPAHHRTATEWRSNNSPPTPSARATHRLVKQLAVVPSILPLGEYVPISTTHSISASTTAAWDTATRARKAAGRAASGQRTSASRRRGEWEWCWWWVASGRWACGRWAGMAESDAGLSGESGEQQQQQEHQNHENHQNYYQNHHHPRRL